MSNQLTQALLESLKEGTKIPYQSPEEMALANTTRRKEMLVNAASAQKLADYQHKINMEEVALFKEANRERTMGEFTKDTYYGLAGKGSLMAGKTAYGIADFVSQLNPVNHARRITNEFRDKDDKLKLAPSLDELTAEWSDDGKSMSQRFASQRERFSEEQSSKLRAQEKVVAQRAERRRLNNEKTRSEDDNIFQKIGQVGSDVIASARDYVDHPSLLFDVAIESAPQMFIPGGLANQFKKQATKNLAKKNLKDQTEKKAGNLAQYNADRMTKKYLKSKEGKEAINKIAERTGVGFTVAAEGFSNGMAIQAEILNTKHEDLLEASPEYVRLLEEENLTPDEARRKIAERAGLITTAGAGLLGGTISKVTGAGKLMGNMFKINSPLGKGIAAKITSNPIGKTIAGAGIESLEEMGQEGAGQFFSNVGKKYSGADPEQDLGEGVTDSMGAGLAVGGATGGVLTGAANIPSAIKSTTDGAKTVKNVVKKSTDKVVERAERNKGVNKNVKEAIKTGDTSEVLKKNESGHYTNPVDAVSYTLRQKVDPKDKIGLKKQIDNALLGMMPIIKKVKENKATDREKELLIRHSGVIKQLKQDYEKLHREDVAKTINEVKNNTLGKSPESKNRLKSVVSGFGNVHFEDEKSAKEAQSQIETILRSNPDSLSDSDKVTLNDALDIAKSYDVVTKEIFEGESKQFTGINTYKRNITAAVNDGNKQVAETELDRLKAFASKHREKGRLIQRAVDAFRKPESERTVADNKAIKLAENRKRLNGENFYINSKTGALANQISKEVKALDTTIRAMSNKIKESAIETATSDNTVNNPSFDTSPEEDSNTVQKQPSVSSYKDAEASTTESSTKTPDKQSKSSEGLTEPSTKSQVGTKTNSGTPGADLLAKAKTYNLKIAPEIIKNPEHKKSIKRLKNKINAYEENNPKAATFTESTEAKGDSPKAKGASNKTDLNKPLKDLEEQSKKIQVENINSPKGRAEYLSKRNNLYRKEYNSLVKELEKEGIKEDIKRTERISEEKVQNINTIEKAIKEVLEIKNKLENNKKLKKEFNEVTKEASKYGVKVTQKEKDIVNNQSPEHINTIPKIVDRITKQTKESKENYDVRKGIFSQGRKQEEYVSSTTNKIVMPESDNPMDDYFEWDSTVDQNILQDTPNAFEQFRDLLNQDGLTNTQREGVELIIKFHDTFKEKFFKDISKKYNKFMHQDSIHYLLKDSENLDLDNITEEDIDPNIITAMAIAGMLWLKNKGPSTVINNQVTLNSLLGINDTKAPIPPYVAHVLRDAGVPFSTSAKEGLGKDVMKLLGIKPKKDTYSDIAQALEDSFSNHIMNAMAKMDVIEFTKRPNWIINELKKGNTSKDQIVKLHKGKIKGRRLSKNDRTIQNTYIKIKTQVNPEFGNLEMVSNENKTGSGNYVEALRNTDNLFEEIFKVEFEKEMPLFKLPKEVTNNITNSDQKVPKKVKEKLKKMESNSSELNKKGMENFEYFDKEEMLTMLGYKKDYKDKHITEQITIEGKNNTLTNEYNKFKEFLKRMPDRTSKFWFKNAVQKTHRMNPKSQLVNVQASKFHRMMVSLSDHVVKIDTTNKEHVSKLYRAIAASLGLKVERLSDKQVKRELDNLLDQEVFRDAIEVLKDRPKSKTEKNKVIKAVLEAGEGPWSLEGLSTFADYLNARDGDNKSFETSLFREPDGITNGTAIALLQFVKNIADTIARLKRVGIFDNSAENYVDYSQNNDDSYEDIARKWGKGVAVVKHYFKNPTSYNWEKATRYNTNIEDLNTFSTKSSGLDITLAAENSVGSFTEEDSNDISAEGRKLSKDPLMTHNYGAGIKKIINRFTENRLHKLYSDINKYAKIINNKKDHDETTVLNAEFELNNIKSNLEILTDSEINIDKILEDPVNWELDYNQLNVFNTAIALIYSDPLEIAFKEGYGDILERRSMMTTALKISFEIFQNNYKKEYNKLIKKNGNHLPSRDQVKELNEKLISTMPIFKGVFSEDDSTGILAAKQVTNVSTNNKAISTKTTFKTSFPVNRLNPNNLTDKETHTDEHGIKTLDLHPTEISWEDNGVGGPVNGIHNIDAATMLTALSEVIGTNIHDAPLLNMLTADEDTQKLNKAFYDVNKNHSLMNEVYITYFNAIKFQRDQDKKNKEEPLVALNRYIKKKALLGYEDGKEVELADFDLEFAAANDENNELRKELFSDKGIQQVNQYTDGPETTYIKENAQKIKSSDNKKEDKEYNPKEVNNIITREEILGFHGYLKRVNRDNAKEKRAIKVIGVVVDELINRPNATISSIISANENLNGAEVQSLLKQFRKPIKTAKENQKKINKEHDNNLEKLLKDKDSTIKSILVNISKDEKYPRGRRVIAKVLSKLFNENTWTVVINDFKGGTMDKLSKEKRESHVNNANKKGAYGEHFPEFKTIVLNNFELYSGVNLETFLHEITHAVTHGIIEGTQKNLTIKQKRAVKELEALFEKVKNNDELAEFKNQLENLHEFVAYGWTNKAFQEALNKVIINENNESGWSKFVNIVRNALGIPANQNSVLSELLRITEDITSITDEMIEEEDNSSLNNDAVIDNLEKHINETIKGLKEETNSLKEKLNSINNEIEDNNGFGSSGGNDFMSDFYADKEVEITDKTSKDIYEDLGKDDPVKDTSKHDKHLRDLLDTLVNKVINPTKMYLQEKGNRNLGFFNLKDNSIYMVMATASPNKMFSTNMSRRETYLHELIHVITYNLIDGNSSAAKELRKLFDQVRNAKKADGTRWLTYKDFIDPNVKPGDANYKQEVKLAKDRYNYIFGHKVSSRISPEISVGSGEIKNKKMFDAYHEFLAHALTNEAFINKLSKFDEEVTNVKHGAETWMGKFTQWFQSILDKFINTYLYGNNASKKDINEKLMILAAQLSGIDARKKNVLWQKMEEVESYLGKTLEKLADTIIAPIKKVVHSQKLDMKNKVGKIIVGTARAIPYSTEIIKALQISADAVNFAQDGLIMSILHELRGQDKDNAYLHKLSRASQNFIDRLRMKRFNEVSEYVRNSYLSDLTDEKNKALSNLIIADISGIFTEKEGVTKYDGDYLDKLYNDSNFRKKEIARIHKEIDRNFSNKKQSRYYKLMSSSMGHEMVTNESIQKVSVMNTKIIVDMDGTQIKPKGDLELAEQLIDTLASLYAVEYTDSGIRETVGQVIKDEFALNKKENGITNTLGLHRENKKRSKKELFNGSDKLFIKGYNKERFGQNKSFVVAPESHEEVLKKQGYIKKLKVSKEKGVDPNEDTTMYMYVSSVNTNGRWLSGIVSMTGARAKGTDLINIYAQQGELDPAVQASYDRPKIKNIKMEQLQDIANGTGVPRKSTDGGNLAPIFNSRGEMVNFRYKMSEKVKKDYLDKDYSLDNILGGMESNIIDKNHSRAINNKLIKKTYDFFVKNNKGLTADELAYKGYVAIGPKAIKKEHRDIYRMLPEEFKDEIRNVWGGDTMFVKSEEVSFIFGERELLLSNTEKVDPNEAVNNFEWMKAHINNTVAFLLNRKEAKYIETIWKEIISMAKDAIVIKSGVVLLANMISNTVLLRTMGVSSKDIFKYHGEALTELRNHKKHSAELAKLKLDTQVNPQNKKKNLFKIEQLTSLIDNNSVNELIDAGMYQHVVEDVDLLRDDSYKSRLNDWLDKNKTFQKVSNATPDLLKTVGKNVAMTHDTSVYKFMRDMTQASDFIARYTLHKHHMNKKKDKMTAEESLELITAAFVNYTPPTHRYLQYANDMGAVMFTKFFLRIQGVILYLARVHPGGLAALLLGQQWLGDIDDIGDAFLPVGLDGRVNNILDVSTQIITSPGTIRGLDTAID